jgi:hypothetical protein
VQLLLLWAGAAGRLQGMHGTSSSSAMHQQQPASGSSILNPAAAAGASSSWTALQQLMRLGGALSMAVGCLMLL